MMPIEERLLLKQYEPYFVYTGTCEKCGKNTRNIEHYGETLCMKCFIDEIENGEYK